MKISLQRIYVVVLSLVLLVFIIGPFGWVVNASFQRRVELFSRPPTWLPSSLYLENYKEVLQDPVLIRSLTNSFLVSSTTTLLALVIGSLAGYAFARFRFPAKNGLFLAILGSQMLPGVAILIPLYLTMQRLKLIYTYQGLILAYLTFSLPYVIWLLRAYFLSIPAEIEDAARVDGCTRIGALMRVVVPLSAPGFVSTGIFVFIGAWNEFMLATVLTNNKTKTMPVKLAQYIGEESTAYESMFVAAILATLPTLILVLIFQRYIIRGLTEGGIK